LTVFVYVEGGGDQRSTLSACREGFAAFFAKFVHPGSLPRVIAGGSRNTTFDSFCTRISIKRAGDTILLLVDSEGRVTPGMGVWAHVGTRDHWGQPPGTTDDNLHLMVQCTEAWFLADLTAVATYYGAGFRRGALPANPNVELVAKAAVLDGLSQATVATKRGGYHKTRHGFDLLARLDPGAVRSSSAYAERFCTTLIRVV
jgi:hypothetical protein